ncbi:MAG TPA: amino acid permease [Candidatus Polarisedimenticolaceae bacterium]|nr:amino acid permease [Candidatus Polarisedimenticolaceae bacterium]
MQLQRVLRLGDGLAVVVGIMVGSGILRTPGIVAARLGRPGLTFLAWALGGALAWIGAMVFAELSTRHPRAGGKYVFAAEAFGSRAAFTIGWIETGIYCAAIAAIAVVCGEYAALLGGAPASWARALGAGFIVLVTGVNLAGVIVGRWSQDVVTVAKLLALGGVVVAAAALGRGAGWSAPLPAAPQGMAVFGAMAAAFIPVLWTYYGYPDVAKIAEEVVDPQRNLPRIYLAGIAIVTGLYLLLNAAFLHVLPLERIAGSPLVAGEVMQQLFGARGAALTAGLALLVVLACLNGNVFVTPRVVFGLARDGLAPPAFRRVRRGTPWTATLLVGALALLLEVTGSFEWLLTLAILLVLLTDGFMVLVLFRLRARERAASFRVPLYPVLPTLFLVAYAAAFVAAVVDQPKVAGITVAALAATYAAARRR